MAKSIFARTRERRGFAQDVSGLQQFIQSQQQLANANQQLAILRALPLAQRQAFQGQVPQFPAFTPFPTSQSQAGADLFSNFLLQQQRQQGALGLQQQQQRGALELQAARPVTPVRSTFQQISDPATGQQINALVNPVTGNIIKKFGTIEQGLSPKDKTQIAVTQAKEFRADPRIEDLGIVERSERGMTAALNQARRGGSANRIASDQALGVLFQKMLDPTSVVRESEFARTPQGASMINRITGSIKQLVTGGLGLEDEDRQALVDMARKLLQEAKISANRAFSEFETRADEIGLNKKIVFGGAKPFNITEEPIIQPTIGLTPAEQSRLAELERLERGQ